MEVAITAIGTANPPYRFAQEQAAEIIAARLYLTAAKKRILNSVCKATGIQYRYSILKDYRQEAEQFEFFPNNSQGVFPTTATRMQIYKTHAIELALQAIKNCLKDHNSLCKPHKSLKTSKNSSPSTKKNFNENEITHLIVVSCTGMYAPGIDIEIVQRLNLNSNIKRTAINFMGCYGAFNGLKVAESICRAESNAKVLMVSVELCTIHVQQNCSMDNIVSNSIFADGAAAILIEASPKQKKYFNIATFHCDLLPQSNHDMTWTIADHGFDMVLSSYVPKLIESGITAFTDKLLASYQMAWSDIDFYAIHPGGIKILQACEKALKLHKNANTYAYQVLRDYGNMSSATIIFVLQKIWQALKSKDHNKNIFSCAFGPGLTLESMLLKTNYL